MRNLKSEYLAEIGQGGSGWGFIGDVRFGVSAQFERRAASYLQPFPTMPARSGHQDLILIVRSLDPQRLRVGDLLGFLEFFGRFLRGHVDSPQLSSPQGG